MLCKGATYAVNLKRIHINSHTTLQTFKDYRTQSVSRLVDITVGGDFLGLCDQKSSYKHVSDFGRLRSYDRLKLRIKFKDY